MSRANLINFLQDRKAMKRAALLLFVTILCITAEAQAVVVFQDDFNDGILDGWTTHRNDAAEWGISGGVLSSSIGSDDRHDPTTITNGSPGWALIAGVTTPNHFRLEADVSVSHYQDTLSGSTLADHGHVGFAFGVQSPDATNSDFNAHYLRTHSDHVTSWSTTNGFFSSPELVYGVGPTTNGGVYHLSLEVDYVNKILTSTFINGANQFSQTLIAANFDAVVGHAGGRIGLLNYGEETTFDNVVLHSFDVPEPASIGLMLSGFVFGVRRRAKKAS